MDGRSELKEKLKRYAELYDELHDAETRLASVKDDVKEIKQEMEGIEKWLVNPELQQQLSLPFGGRGEG